MTVETTAGAGAGTATYTHREWKHDVGTVLLTVAGIVRDLMIMDACLGQVAAGRTQRRLVAQAITAGRDLLQAGLAFVKVTDERLLPIGMAIHAVGLYEVAQEKTYHQV